jgi:hypothetical protein
MASTIRWLFAAVAVIAAVMSVSAAARADYVTGNELYADCTAPDGENARSGFCQGYIAAIADVARQTSQVPTLGVLGEVECADKNVTLKQMFDVVTRYLAAYPETRHLAAASLVAHALAEAFPCK